MIDLDKLPRNRFTYQEFIETYGIEDYQRLKEVLDQLIADGKIKGIKRNGKTTFQPHIYKAYRKVSQQPDYEEARKDIIHLHPKMIGYYHARPEDYLQSEREIVILSDYLKSHEIELKDPAERMSRKERSYQIFGEEKKLESREVRSICSSCNITDEDLNCYPTYEPFFNIRIQDDPEGCAIILENKDPWDSIARELQGKRYFLGKKISYVIYGEGNKITTSDISGRFSSFVKNLNPCPSLFLYCGDLDKAGVQILVKLRKVNPDLDIRPFTQLYLEMKKKAPSDWKQLENTDDRHTKTYDESFLEQFEREDREYIRNVLDHDKRIPQEILNRKDYRRMVK